MMHSKNKHLAITLNDMQKPGLDDFIEARQIYNSDEHYTKYRPSPHHRCYTPLKHFFHNHRRTKLSQTRVKNAKPEAYHFIIYFIATFTEFRQEYPAMRAYRFHTKSRTSNSRARFDRCTRTILCASL